MEEVWRVPRTGTTKEGFPGEWKVNTQGEGTQGEGTRGEGTRGRAPGGGHLGEGTEIRGASIAASRLRGEARSLHF